MNLYTYIEVLRHKPIHNFKFSKLRNISQTLIIKKISQSTNLSDWSKTTMPTNTANN